MTKKCRRCGQYKSKADFTIAPKNKDGLRKECKPCVSEMNSEYWKTPKGRLNQIFSVQVQNSKMRGHSPPKYSKEQLHNWAAQNGYHQLYDSWKLRGFQKEDTPSVDRIDTSKGYSLDNIRMVTWNENNHAQYTGRVKGEVITSQCKAVQQFTKDGVFIKEFTSIALAARATGAVRSNINAMCTGANLNIKSVAGYVWKYSN